MGITARRFRLNKTIMSKQAYNYVKKRRRLLNISEIERTLDLPIKSLWKSINDDRPRSRHDWKIEKFLNTNFPGWDKHQDHE